MRIKFSDLYRWDGTVDRGPYALIGVLGFAIKHNLDRFVASAIFHRHWDLFNYWVPPTQAVRISTLPRQDAALLGTLLALSLPFIWLGVVLTLRRLRAVGLPTALVVFFFAPVVNLIFFAILSVLPSRPAGGLGEPPTGGRSKVFLDRMIPESPVGSAAMAVFLTAIFGALAAVLMTLGVGRYGFVLFTGLPFCLGLASVLLYGYHRPRNYLSCLLVSALSIILLGFVLVAVAIEGALCLMMAAPIAVAIAWIGGTIGYFIQSRPWNKTQVPATLLLLVLFLPALMAAESATPLEPLRREIRTEIEVNAPPEVVWQRLVTFPDLPKPEEWLFRLGIAYPIRATVEGQGAGAVRRCLFSTGTFVEPVDVWDEPRTLKFSVVADAPPMRELTPYREIHPPHLEGYLQPEQAEFRLTKLPDGRTRLEGTSWYRNRMWPASYWQIWSDLIIHQVHLRVFRHIKRLAERQSSLKAAR